MSRISFTLTCLLVALVGTPVSAAVVHSEAVDGDLSGAFGAPTAITLMDGSNQVIGQTGANGGTGATNDSDADYFTFTVAANQTLDSLLLDSYTFSPSNPGSSFMGFVEGPAFGGQGGGDIDGSWFFNASSSGNGLDAFGTGPLGPGQYSIWIQETSSTAVDYTLSLNLTTAVPEPTTVAPLAVLAIGMLTRRRGRREA